MKNKLDVIDINGHSKNDTRQEATGAKRRNANVRERERKRARRRRRIELYTRLVVVAAIAVIFFLAGLTIKTVRNHKDDLEENSIEYSNASVSAVYSQIAENYQSNTPKTMNSSEALETLESLIVQYPEFEEIYTNADQYPEDLIVALCNNPEMYEFVKGYPDADTSVSGKFTSQELKEDYPLFLQWDERWGYVPYGGSMIGLAGCGPTCLSMVITALTDSETTTPAEVASYSMSNGYYVEGTGTAWSLMTEGVEHFGVTARELSLDEGVMKNALDQGHPIICSMGPGDFTAVGHFIVIYGYDEDGFKINDPNCVSRSEKRWSYEELSWQIRILWAYSAT